MPSKPSRKSTKAPTGKGKSPTSTLTRKYARTILKPLGRKEGNTAVQQALEVVLHHGGAQHDRVRVYPPLLRIEKPTLRGGAPTRLICVHLRDRDRGATHEVSIAAGAVTQHTVDENASPPFSDEERDEARQLMLDDPALRKLLARKGVEIEWFNPEMQGRGRLIGARILRVANHQVVEEIGETEVELDKGVLRDRRARQ